MSKVSAVAKRKREELEPFPISTAVAGNKSRRRLLWERRRAGIQSSKKALKVHFPEFWDDDEYDAFAKWERNNSATLVKAMRVPLNDTINTLKNRRTSRLETRRLSENPTSRRAPFQSRTEPKIALPTKGTSCRDVLSREAKELAEIWADSFIQFPNSKMGGKRNLWVEKRVFEQGSGALRKLWREKAKLASFERCGLVAMVPYNLKDDFRRYRDGVRDRKQIQIVQPRIAENPEEDSRHIEEVMSFPSCAEIDPSDVGVSLGVDAPNKLLSKNVAKVAKNPFQSMPCASDPDFPQPPKTLSAVGAEFARYWGASLARYPSIQYDSTRRDEFVEKTIMAHGSTAMKQRWSVQSAMPSFKHAGLGSVAASNDRDQVRRYRDVVKDYLIGKGVSAQQEFVETVVVEQGNKKASVNSKGGRESAISKDVCAIDETEVNAIYRRACLPSDILQPPSNLCLESIQIAIFWAKILIELPDPNMGIEREELMHEMILEGGSHKLRHVWNEKVTMLSFRRSGFSMLVHHKERVAARIFRDAVKAHLTNDKKSNYEDETLELSPEAKELAEFWARCLVKLPSKSRATTAGDRKRLVRKMIFDEGSERLQQLWNERSDDPSYRHFLNSMVPPKYWRLHKEYRDQVLLRLMKENEEARDFGGREGYAAKGFNIANGAISMSAVRGFLTNTVGAKIQGFLASAGYLVPSTPDTEKSQNGNAPSGRAADGSTCGDDGHRTMSRAA